MFDISVDTERCDGCSSCVDACPMNVLIIAAGHAGPDKPENCMGCQLCEVDCPDQAIAVIEG